MAVAIKDVLVEGGRCRAHAEALEKRRGVIRLLLLRIHLLVLRERLILMMDLGCNGKVHCLYIYLPGTWS